MGYPPEHKQQTRDRIVVAARHLWKAHGYANVSINQIMKQAGLTHGGFYAHFKSKDELFSEAAMDTKMLDRYRDMITMPDVTPQQVFEMVLDYYLSAAHRDNPAEGCPLVALSEDVWRLGKGAQGAYTKLTDTAVKQLAHVLGGDDALARMVLSSMVGAITLARGVGDGAKSLKILDDTRVQLVKIVEQQLD